jgi:hypothetical protein
MKIQYMSDEIITLFNSISYIAVTAKVQDYHLTDGGIDKGRHGAQKEPHILQQCK